MDGTLWKTARALYITALWIFVVTVVIGILNGTNLVAFGVGDGLVTITEEWGDKLLLTHLHAGTLGFITLAIVAGAMRMFTENRSGDVDTAGARGMGMAMAVSITLYVLAFATTKGVLRPIAGTLVFLAVAWLFIWLVRHMRGQPVTIPQLALLGAFVSLVLGAVFGILLGIFISNGSIPGFSDQMGARIGESHPATMVVGYLILAGLGLIEWLMTDEQRQARNDRWGIVQVVVVFLAGLAVLVGILADNFNLAALNTPLEVIGIVILLVRMRKELAPSGWAESVPGLYARLAVIWLIGAIAALGVLVNGIVSGKWADFADIPLGLVLSMDHMNFLGVLAMVTFGLLVAALGHEDSADRWVLAGVNIGLAAFIIGLLSEVEALKMIGTPVLGAALLWGIWRYVGKLQATA